MRKKSAMIKMKIILTMKNENKKYLGMIIINI